MKNKKAIILFILINSFKLFASAPIYVNYKTEKIAINQFLCFSSEFDKDIVSNQSEAYLQAEKRFIEFCYFTDALSSLYNITGKKISFSSQTDGSMLSIGSKTFLFAPKYQENDERFKGYYFTNDYNNPYFLIQYVCNMSELQIPEIINDNKKLFSLEAKSKNEIDFTEFNETDILFFYPDGEIYYPPCFEMDNKNYIGFYYSEEDAMEMKKILEERYFISSMVKEFPLDFSLINMAYFKISYF